MRMRHIVTWPAPLYNIFPHYLINGTILGKKLLNIKCVFWFSLQLLSETLLILRRITWDIALNVRRSSCKLPVTPVRFDWNLNFLDRFSQNTQNTEWHENLRPVGAELHAEDGRADATIWMVAFRNFLNAFFLLGVTWRWCFVLFCRCRDSSVIFGLVYCVIRYLSNRLRLTGFLYCAVLSRHATFCLYIIFGFIYVCRTTGSVVSLAVALFLLRITRIKRPEVWHTWCGTPCTVLWIGFVWLRTSTSGEVIWTQEWSFGFQREAWYLLCYRQRLKKG